MFAVINYKSSECLRIFFFFFFWYMSGFKGQRWPRSHTETRLNGVEIFLPWTGLNHSPFRSLLGGLDPIN